MFVSAVSKTGAATHVLVHSVESFDFDRDGNLHVNLQSGRQHSFNDDRARDLYAQLCERLHLEPVGLIRRRGQNGPTQPQLPDRKPPSMPPGMAAQMSMARREGEGEHAKAD
jgi:hypothetical protein